jgi:hypothetical protein
MTESSDLSKNPKETKHEGDRGSDITIVGGRPSGRAGHTVTISRGVEILVKKASVDAEFRALLLEKRAEAAREIDLQLSAAETLLLNSVPRAHIERIIANTTVPTEHRRVFLGRVAALMLAVLGTQLEGCNIIPESFKYGGIRPDMPVTPPRGIPQCKPEDVRLDPDGKRLSYEVLVQGPSSVLLTVRYNRPFHSGRMEVSCRSGDVKGKTQIIYRSNQVQVPPGQGAFELWIRGDKGETDWLIISLIESAVESEETKKELLTLPKPPYEPGEYVMGKCLVYRIAKFHKEWRG